MFPNFPMSIRLSVRYSAFTRPHNIILICHLNNEFVQQFFLNSIEIWPVKLKTQSQHLEQQIE
jgi:hypothetical protein